MQIGEFAKICETKISVLRHYDKEGLLIPDFTDPFTGYRYYRKEQIGEFRQIAALKKAGFSLKEIRGILPEIGDSEKILSHIRRKKTELRETLQSLREAEQMLVGGEIMIQVEINEETQKMITMPIHPEEFHVACEKLAEEVAKGEYQRVSWYQTLGEAREDSIRVAISVVKLQPEVKQIWENTDIPFENDESIVGKWEVLGDFATKEEFEYGMPAEDYSYGNRKKEIYFLPEGEQYWIYGWTKGFLKVNCGDGASLNAYEVEERADGRYMFVQNKSYYYRRGGQPTVLVLKQLDNKAYTSREIAREDDIDMPFVEDAKVLGKWKSIAFIRNKEEFDSDCRQDEKDLYFKSIEFFPQGECTSVYEDGEISGAKEQVWTKGYVLRKWHSAACAYEIREIEGKTYMMMEWKSGDYRWGGFDSNFYVFEKVEG